MAYVDMYVNTVLCMSKYRYVCTFICTCVWRRPHLTSLLKATTVSMFISMLTHYTHAQNSNSHTILLYVIFINYFLACLTTFYLNFHNFFAWKREKMAADSRGAYFVYQLIGYIDTKHTYFGKLNRQAKLSNIFFRLLIEYIKITKNSYYVMILWSQTQFEIARYYYYNIVLTITSIWRCQTAKNAAKWRRYHTLVRVLMRFSNTRNGHTGKKAKRKHKLLQIEQN